MSLCQGQVNGKKHNASLWRCSRCGVYGCNHNDCSNQKFDWGNGRCLACGGFNTKRSA